LKFLTKSVIQPMGITSLGLYHTGYKEFSTFIKFVKKEILILVVALAFSAVVAHNFIASVSL